MANESVELKIYNLEDRMTVAQILIKNGYTVGQGKGRGILPERLLNIF